MPVTVVVFPVSPQLWYEHSRYVKRVPNGERGTFRVAGLPPGEYLVAAVTRLMAGRDVDPALLEALAPDAARVAVSEREQRSVSLKLIRR